MNTQPADDKIQTPTQTTSPVGSLSKEQEVSRSVGAEAVQEVVKDVEISPEVEKAGITAVNRQSIELPPDVKKLGVTQSGSSTPVATATTVTTVVLPISDQQVVAGLHAQIMSSLRWLAVWCLKKLQKAHVVLKVIHGKIVRVKS